MSEECEDQCKDCFYHDPFDGEETIWFEILENHPDSVRCGFGFTYEETVIGNYGNRVGKNQSCKEFLYPNPVGYNYE